MAKRSRSRKLWQPLGIPSTATSSSYQDGNRTPRRTPRRIRASGIDLRWLIRSRSVAAEAVSSTTEEAIPPTSTHAGSLGQGACDRLCVNPA